MGLKEAMEYFQLMIVTSVSAFVMYHIAKAILVEKLSKLTNNIVGRICIDDVIASLDSPDKLSARQVKMAIERAQADGIKGLIVQINSGGGGVAPSKEIADCIGELEIPTVACIRELCASGGYMIASACDHIVAHEYSLVGNIGVISPSFDISGLLEKIGIKYRSELKSVKYKDIGNPFRAMSLEEVEIQKAHLQEIHEMFVEYVARNRDLSVQKTREVANGLLYSGKNAKELELIDAIGDTGDALNYINTQIESPATKIIDYRVVKGKGIFGMFSKMSYALGKSFSKGIIDEIKTQTS